MATPNIVPRATGEGGLGTAGKGWGNLFITNTTGSSATQGGKLSLQADDGALMGSGHRLGIIEFKGAEDDANNLTVGARIEAVTEAAWSSTVNDCSLQFYTTDANASESLVLTLDSNKLATFTGAATITGALTGTLSSAAQNNITSATSCVAVGALNAGTITSGFGNIDNGSSTLDTGAINGTTIDAATDFTVGTTVISDDSIVMTPSTGDTLTISSTTHGASTIKTIDTGAAAADINIDADGVINFSNTSTNNVRVTAGGITGLNYRALWLDSTQFTPAGTAGAVSGENHQFHATTASTNNVLRFNESTNNFADIHFVMPEQWDTTTFKVKIHWTSLTGTGDVKWGIKARGVTDGTNFTGGWGTEVTVVDTRLGENMNHVTAATSAITPAENRGGDTLLVLRVTRLADDSADTKGDDALLFGVQLQYQETLTPTTVW